MSKTYTAPSIPHYGRVSKFRDGLDLHDEIARDVDYQTVHAAQALHSCIEQCVAMLHRIEDGDTWVTDASGAGASGPPASQIASATAALHRVGGLLHASRFAQAEA